MIKILNHFEQKFDILTEEQRRFLSLNRENVQAENFDYFYLNKEEKADYTFPNAFSLRWTPNIPAEVYLSEKEDLSKSILLSGVGECKITNLKSDTRYFVQVVAGNDCSEIYSFATEYAPFRFLKIEGLTNVRDLGGRKAQDGRTIKQGMFFRGTEMNSHLTITEEGLATMRDVLKIQTVLDLRSPTEEVEDVYKRNYKNVPTCAYAHFLTQYDAICAIFDILSKEENYPIYYHCWGGADRTGTLSFLIGALLGEDETALLDDYEITSLSVWGTRSRNLPLFQEFLDKLEECEGATLSQKTENLLLALGVDKEKIQAIKRIMLESLE